MPDVRPPITHSLTLFEFSSWYWLKTDLAVICRTFGLPPNGSKLELEDKIRKHLSGVAITRTGTRRATGRMPKRFTPETVIGHGWSCNPALGAYLRTVCGPGFRFNARMRDFIHNGAGRTLADAAVSFRAGLTSGSPKLPIAKQLEYNQHFRDFFAAQPNATRQQAIDAWWEKRSRRIGTHTRND